MPPRKRAPAPAPRPIAQRVTAGGRKVTRTVSIVTSLGAALAIADRIDPPAQPADVSRTFDVERIAGPRDTGARWRFLIPGQMLVVDEKDLPIIEALIIALNTERLANQP